MPRVAATFGLCLIVLATLAATPAQALSQSRQYSAEDLHCLALAMYFEARAEGREGMTAVAAVILNRVRHPGFPRTICGVVRQGGETPPCQFSFWCDGKSDVPTNEVAWAKARNLAGDLLTRSVSDPTGGALFFHASFISKPWGKNRIRTAQIGRHVFYR